MSKNNSCNFERGYKFKNTRITFLSDCDPLINEKGRKTRMFFGVCECGTFVKKSVSKVKSATTKSCGCLMREEIEKVNNRFREEGVSHGCSRKKGFHSYRHMMDRCYDENHDDYYNYGALGIKVCDRWRESNGQGVKNFFEDMGEKPPNLTLDRIDTLSNYSPDNCRWTDLDTQAYNKRFRPQNQSGKTGVTKRKDGYVAHIGCKNKKIYLGFFKTFEDAVKAREDAEIKYRGKKLGH